MSKKIVSAKNLISRDKLDNDDTDNNPLLYGKVNAVAGSENASASAPWGTSAAPGANASESHNASSSTAGTLNNLTSSAAPVITAATTTSSVSKVYQHWADGDAARGTTAEWNNNILSDIKSDYFEGEVVPHVYVYKASNSTPLLNGHTYSFNVTYNYYQSNTNAGGFVYMTSPDIDRHPSNFNGSTAQADSTFTNGGGMQGHFNTVNANITAVSNVTYLGNPGSTLDGKVTITFVYTRPDTTSGGAEIQYGLMIAAPGDVPDQGKGMTDGANAWTGGSLQTTVDIGGTGATSIQLAPSAIIVGEISGMKFSDVDGNGVRDADGADNIVGTADDEVGLANWKIFLDQNNDGQWEAGETYALTDATGHYTFSVVPDADRSDPDNDPYIVREVQQAGWVRTTANPAPILITAADPTETNVNFGNMLLKPSLNIVKDASVPGGTADHAGEIISYTIAVQNTGNQTLTGVTVNDPFISNLTLVADAATADGELDVGETWHYTATHEVTQAEIDAGGNIVNVATADSDQTGPDTDDASIPVEQLPSLNIVKDASVPGGTADHAGEVISYTIAVENTGNQTLTGVVVSDPFINNSLTLVADAASADGKLDVGETWHYTATHEVTQAEIDAGGNIVNVATADSDQTGPSTDDASIPVEQLPSLNIVKEASVPGGTADRAGEIISYTIAVENTGNQTLTGVTVSDPFINSSLTLVADAASADGELDVGETWHYTATHEVTQAEMDAGVNIVNLATADSDQTGPDTDDAFVPVSQAPAIAIDKAIVGVNGGNGNGTLDAVNDVVRYAVTVTNTGNITLHEVTVSDPFTGLTVNGVTLAPGASETYLTSYTLTQTDLNTNGGGDGFIENTATADSLETGAVSDTEAIEIFAAKALSIDKKLVSITNGNGNDIADAVDDVLNYTVTVTNQGTITLTNVSVVDASSGLNKSGLTLQPGESQTFETSYKLTQTDLNNNGDGHGYIVNTATADSDQTLAISDSEATPLLRTVGLGIEKSIHDISGSNLFADNAGEVITYDIKVYNAGTVTLTSVTVTDELTHMNETLASLAPGQTVYYSTQYTVQQADLDNVGSSGLGAIENVSVADSDQTLPVSDGETVPLLAKPLLFLNKTFVNVTGGNGNGLADAVGDQLNYKILVANPGNVTLTDLYVHEPLTGLDVNGETLAPNGVLTYQVHYTLTQADLDHNGDLLGGPDGYIDNIAYADSAQTAQVSDTESVPILRSIGLTFDKDFTGVTGGNGNALADCAGDELNFSMTVKNVGTVTLHNVVVTDPATGLNETLASLAPGASQSYTASYLLKQSDLDSNGGGDGRVENSATVVTNETKPVSDTEGVTVIYDAQIDLTKYVSVDQGATWQDANTATGPTLLSSAGFNPWFKYTALNNGTVTLHDATLADAAYDLNGAEAGKDWYWGDIAPGQLAEFIYQAPYTPGQNSGDAVVTAYAGTTLTPMVTDIDNAYYLGA